MGSQLDNLKVFIPCGGKGTRLGSLTNDCPKPLVTIGENPILWHIMKLYAHHGVRDFVLGLGYKGDRIRQFFSNYDAESSDITVDLSRGEYDVHSREDWRVTLVNTGVETNTGRRLGKASSYLQGNDIFLATYGDGVSDVNIEDLVEYHLDRGKLVTMTAVNPHSRYGEIKIRDGLVEDFIEKPVLKEERVNGGFMVFDRSVLDRPFLKENIMLEEVLARLVREKEVAAFMHNGFWHSMDTQRDYDALNDMWDSGKAPWRVW